VRQVFVGIVSASPRPPITFVVNTEPSSKVWFVGNKKTFHPILDIGPHILKFDMLVPVFRNIFSLNMLLSTGTKLPGNKILPEPEKCKRETCTARERCIYGP
jgi:hypothetical protein